MVKCCIVGCTSGYKSNKEVVSQFCVPKDPLRNKWIKAISRLDFKISKNTYVCEKHFNEHEIVRYWISGSVKFSCKKMRCSVLFCLFVTAATATVNDGSKYPKVVVLSLGGLRLDLANKYLEGFREYLAKYASAKYLVPVMPTKGPVNHASITTGLYADGHGVIDDCEYDEPEGRCDYGRIDTTKTTIWTENQSRGGYSALINWPGSEQYHGRKKEPYYLYDKKYDRSSTPQVPIFERIDQIVSWLLNEHKPANLVMVYYPELDRVLRENSADSETGQEELFYAQYFIKNLISEIDRYKIPGVNLIVLGSHVGQTVNSSGGIRLTKILHNCPFVEMGATAIVNPKDDELEYVHDILKKHAQSTGKYNVYYQEDIPENWHLKEMPLFRKNIFLVANIGYFFWNENLDGIKKEQKPKKFVATVDGYWKNTKDDQSSIHTFFMAMGPRFNTQTQVPAFNTIDVYPLLRKLLELPGIENVKLSDAVNQLLLKPTEIPDGLEQGSSTFLEPAVEKELSKPTENPDDNIDNVPNKTGCLKKLSQSLTNIIARTFNHEPRV